MTWTALRNKHCLWETGILTVLWETDINCLSETGILTVLRDRDSNYCLFVTAPHIKPWGSPTVGWYFCERQKGFHCNKGDNLFFNIVWQQPRFNRCGYFPCIKTCTHNERERECMCVCMHACVLVCVCVYALSSVLLLCWLLIKNIHSWPVIQSKELMLRVKNAADKANGYVFGGEQERSMESLMSCAVGAEFEYQKIQDIREKYTDVDSESEFAMENNDSWYIMICVCECVCMWVWVGVGGCECGWVWVWVGVGVWILMPTDSRCVKWSVCFFLQKERCLCVGMFLWKYVNIGANRQVYKIC